MKQWWHILATAGLAALGVVTPVIQAVIAAHPTVSVIIGAVWAVLGSLLPSPLKPSART